MITYTINDWSQVRYEVAYDVTAKAPTGERVRAIVTLAIGDETMEPQHKDVERWVPARMLDFFTAHSEDPSCEVSDGLLDALRAVVSVDDLDVDWVCGRCLGSGEGMHDGSTCGSCRGSGTERRCRDDDDE